MAILSVPLLLGCGDNKLLSMEEAALNHFMKEVWKEGVLEFECSGLTYDAEKRIMVSLTPYQSGEDSEQIGPCSSPMLTMNLVTLDPRLTLARTATPRRTSETYFLRFSNKCSVQGRVQVVLWIKGGYYTSGLRYVYLMDASGSLKLESTLYGCDDWG
ncbi:hypothetical protein AB9P05_12755 [Roseivirga sp. BDSF3-8]|uniref:hypothetical protein n=1 Tax=Roseivirga sp. BDSF3-8 TaxID=3241598 RepID=UPI003531A73E